MVKFHVKIINLFNRILLGFKKISLFFRKQKKNEEKIINYEINFNSHSFSCLINEVEELKQIRKKYSSEPYEERRKIAFLEYQKSIKSGEINNMKWFEDGKKWPDIVQSLAVDPYYAPSILAVGSLEYIYGRVSEAMNLFNMLIALTPDIKNYYFVLERAGNFLLDSDDYQNAFIFYSNAVTKYPDIAMFHNGLSYSSGYLGKLDEAIKHARQAVIIAPENYSYMNDLGYWLMEARNYKEAEKIFKYAITKFPWNSKRVKNNLNILYSKLKPDHEWQPNSKEFQYKDKANLSST